GVGGAADPGRTGRLEDPTCGGDTGRERLLTKHVLAVRQRGQGHLLVRGRDGEVQHGLHVRVGDEPIQRQGTASVEPIGDRAGAGGVEIRRRGDPHAGMGSERREVLRGDDAESDYSDTVRLAHSIPLSMIRRTFASRSTSRLCPGVATKMRPAPHSRVHTAGDTIGRCHGWYGCTWWVVVASTSFWSSLSTQF